MGRVQIASVSIIALLLLVRCGQAPEFPLQRPFEADPATASELSSRDIEVFEAVIAAYARAGEVIGKGRRPPPPPVARRYGPPDSEEPLLPGDIERLTSTSPVRMMPHAQLVFDAPKPRTGAWRSFDQKHVMVEVVASEDAVRDLAARNQKKISLERFTPRYVHVQRTTETKPYESLLVWSLPGYSIAGDEAIIEVSALAPPMGGGGRLIYLRRTAKGWEVVAMQGTWIS